MDMGDEIREAYEDVPTDVANIGFLCHFVPIFLGLLFPLVMYVFKRHEHPYIEEQSKKALNFQLLVAVAILAGYILCILVVGIFIIIGTVIINFVFCVLAAKAVHDGREYDYPLVIKFLR